MGAVASFVEDVVGGVVEAVGDVVDSVVDVVKDVGKAIDDYVIQPILDDPLTAIATVGAATFLGPAAAAYFGTSGAVGVGIAAGAANTAAGLVQGEDFGEAIKGGLMAGVGAGVTSSLFGGTGAEGVEAPTPAPTDALDDFLAQNNNFANVDVGTPTNIGAPTAEVAPPITTPNITATDLPPMSGAPTDAVTGGTAPDVSAAANAPAPVAPAPTPSPLETLNTAAPSVEMPGGAPATSAPSANLPTFTSNLDTSFTPDYSLTSGMKPDVGLQVPQFTPADSFNIYGEPNYDLVPKGISGGPGLQMPSAPNLASMGGGQGLTADMTGLPPYMENGVPTTFTGANGQTYGAATPDVTISSSGANVTPPTITYDATTNMGTPSAWDQLKSGNLLDAAKTVGSDVVDWTKNQNPWVLGAAGVGAASLLGGAGGPPNQPPPPKGSTQDKNFTKSLDLYEYMRDRANYGGDLSKYGQMGQGTPGEHQFFQNTRFVPIPIPGQNPTPAKMGGLIQMKHFAQGGAAQAMQADPRRAQMMAAMAQQHPAGQGMPQGRPAMPQGGMMPGRPMSPQNSPLAQQGRPQPAPQRPRDPRTAYYQYGNPPPQAKAMGGLSQVNSMRIGGGADGRSDDVPAVLSDGEYVMDAETVAMLGNGSSKAGAKKLDDMRAKLRQHKGKALAGGKISPNAKSPLAYLKGA